MYDRLRYSFECNARTSLTRAQHDGGGGDNDHDGGDDGDDDGGDDG